MINRNRWTDSETQTMLDIVNKSSSIKEGFIAASRKLHRSLSGIQGRYYYIKSKEEDFKENRVISLTTGKSIPCCGEALDGKLYKVGDHFLLIKS